jgi:ketosteroid isomerase-like protein
MISVETFKRWVAAINRHDTIALRGLMAPDHVFVDSLGNRMRGPATMQAGWQGYFAMCPDYWLRVDRMLSADAEVLACGEAGGTIDGQPWHTPAAWRAVTREDSVVEWHVFADNKPVYEILKKRQPNAFAANLAR